MPKRFLSKRDTVTSLRPRSDLCKPVGSLPYMKDKTVYITGYGRQDEAPVNGEVPSYMTVARPGMHIPLGPQLCKDIKC